MSKNTRLMPNIKAIIVILPNNNNAIGQAMAAERAPVCQSNRRTRKPDHIPNETHGFGL